MFFAGKGKGGLAFAFGAVASVGAIYGLHLLMTAGLKAGGAAAGVDLYSKLIAQPSEWLAGVFKTAVNGCCNLLGVQAPVAFAGAETAIIPEGSGQGLKNTVSFIKNLFGGGVPLSAPPAPVPL